MSGPTCPRRIGGAMTALVTPFRDRAFDDAAMTAHVEWQLLSGIDGLLVCSLTGEGPALPAGERSRAIEICVELAESKVPVIVATGTYDTATTIEETLHAQRLRADAALVTVPYYSKPTQSGVLHHFRQLAMQTELPLIVHNQPSHTAIDLTGATVAQLAEIPGVVGIADSSGDISRIDRWRALLPDRFGLYTSNDACALAFTIAGGHGCFSSAANIVPRLFQSMQHSAVFGSLAVSRSLGERLQPLFSALARESEPATVKHALSQVRSVRADVRLPLVGVADDTAAAIHAALTRVQCESTGRFAFHQTCHTRL